MGNEDTNYDKNYLEFVKIAEHLFVKNFNHEALEFIDRAIALNANDSWSFYLRGSIKSILKDQESAKSDWTKCVELNGNLSEYLDLLSKLLITEKTKKMKDDFI
jgi:tetratricopeptide (TPR) repeat protein